MRVAFDGAVLAAGPITGVGRAFLTALAAYVERADGPVVLLLPPQADAGLAPAGVEVVPAPLGALSRQTALPRLLRRLGVDLLHSPVAAVPLRAPCPTIATVHDLAWYGPLQRGAGPWARIATRLSVRAATAVLVPSRFTLRCLEHWLGRRRPRRVEIVPHGVAAPDQPARREDLRGPFLVLGDRRRRKNRSRVLAAHRLARARCATLPELCFLGPPDAYVDEDTKLARLRSCRALVHASLFEGFGLPVLEAMAHGVPVICAAAASLPEVGDRAVLYVDPEDVDAIAAAMVHVHENEELRDELRAGGLLRAVEFPPTRPARDWLQLHRSLYR